MTPLTLVRSSLWALALAGCAPSPTRVSPAPPADASLYPVTVHTPSSLRAIEGTTRDLAGRPTEVACATCHATFDPAPQLPDGPANLGGPHAGMIFRHGANECRSCHDPAGYDHLRLATGESVPMTDAMRLCAQCHGPQARDYAHGAHGGMSGHWDLRRGPRVRNHCADCHDPHAPKFPMFRPAPAPLDAPSRHGDHA
jgi:hypothetical protein